MSKNLSKHFANALGGVAAAALSVGAIGHAQVPVAARRDSVTTTRVVLLQGRVDSISLLMHRIAQERYGSPAWVDLTGQLDSLVASLIGNKLSMARRGVDWNMAPRPAEGRPMLPGRGYLGINAQGPTLVITDSSGTRYRYLAYQPIISVDLGSPADRAGIEAGDVLVGYNGVDLINHEFNLGDIIVPKKRVDVTIRRGGEVKEYPLTVASTPDEVSRRRNDFNKVVQFQIPSPGTIVIGDDGEPRFAARGQGAAGGAGRANVGRGVSGADPVVTVGGGFGARGMFPVKLFSLPNGLFGASLSNVSDDLAKALQLPKGLRKGVLVNEVPEDSPAYRGGLRSADVIITADGDTVSTVGQLRDLLITRFGDHSAELQIVRQQKVKKLTLSWQE
jgi:hypothetical protein